MAKVRSVTTTIAALGLAASFCFAVEPPSGLTLTAPVPWMCRRSARLGRSQ